MIHDAFGREKTNDAYITGEPTPNSSICSVGYLRVHKSIKVNWTSKLLIVHCRPGSRQVRNQRSDVLDCTSVTWPARLVGSSVTRL